jgi:serine/threonine protein kinase
MLSKNPDERPTAFEMLQHPWFTFGFESQMEQLNIEKDENSV